MDLLLENGYARPNSLLRNLDSMFSLPRGFGAMTSAAADVVEDADNYRVYLDMPGVKAESVNVQVEDGRVMIEAERKRPEWSKEAELHLAERSYGSFQRSFSIPDDANTSAVAANYRDGVLELTIPKKPESKPQKIKVTVEN